MRVETKVGMFVIVGISMLFLLTTQVNKFRLFEQKSYKIYGKLESASGVELNSKVKMSGVDIGYLEKLDLDGIYVKATLAIYDGIKVPTNSTVSLSQDSLLGGKFIEIKPNRELQTLSYLNEYDEISSDKAKAGFDDMSNSINEVALELRGFIQELRTTLDEEARTNLRDSLSNIKIAAQNISSAGEKFGAMSDEFSKTALILNKEIPILMDKVSLTLNEYKVAGATINNKLPPLMDSIYGTSEEFKLVGENINSKLPTILTKFEKVEDNITSLIDGNTKELNSALVSIDKFFEKGEDTVKKVDKYLDAVGKSEVELSLRNEYMFRDDYSKSFIGVNYKPNPTKAYMLDVGFAPNYATLNSIGEVVEPTRGDDDEIFISAQFAKRYYDVVFRGGLIESRGGVGIDYYMLHDKLKYSFEVFDFSSKNDLRGENPQAKFSLRYTPLKNIDTFIGYNNFLNSQSSSLFLGAGLRFVDDDFKLLLGTVGSSSSFLK